MKKSILALGLLLVVTQNNCGLFDDAMSFLKKTATSLFDKGKKYLSDNSDKILATVKEKGKELFEQGVEMAKEKAASLFGKTGTPISEPTTPEEVVTVVQKAEAAGTTMDEAATLVLSTAKVEAEKETKELAKEAQNIVATTKGLTPSEQKIILQEAQNLANQSREALVKQANESIAQKRATLKSSIYEKYGKGTPTQ